MREPVSAENLVNLGLLTRSKTHNTASDLISDVPSKRVTALYSRQYIDLLLRLQDQLPKPVCDARDPKLLLPAMATMSSGMGNS